MKVNNSIYNDLGERWYKAEDDPIALLRAETRLRNPWIREIIKEKLGSLSKKSLLDVGCGAGFLANDFAEQGFEVFGVDRSEESLKIAKKYDSTKSVHYQKTEAASLPFQNNRFDVVCMMDFLEHVEDPAKVIQEASRVLQKGGLFFFHTFNRNFISWIVAIKGVEWFVKNTPENFHVLSYFIKPKEIRQMCEASNLSLQTLKGVRPVLSKPFWQMLLRGTVGPDFRFRFSSSLSTGYLGYAVKE